MSIVFNFSLRQLYWMCIVFNFSLRQLYWNDSIPTRRFISNVPEKYQAASYGQIVCINPANIRLGEDVLKTSSRRLQCNIFLSSKTSWRRLEDIIARRLANTSWRRLQDLLGRRIANTSWRRLKNVFKRSWKTKSVTLKTSSRRLEKQEMFAGSCL